MMTRLRTGAALVGVMCVVAAAPGLAHGQATPDQKKKAKEHYEKGTTHYNLGRFDEAVDEFTKAFELYPEPVFLYNIAQSYRMKENWERAKFFYKRYLSLAPDAKNRPDVEARIAEMDAELAKPKTGPTTPPVTPPVTTTPTGPTTPPVTTPPVTTTPTGPTTPGTETAQNGSSTGETGVGAVVTVSDDRDGVLGEYRRERPLRLAVGVGPAFVSLGNGPDVPTQVAFAIDAGYTFTKGKLGLGVGTSVGYTPVPYDPVPNSGGEAGTAGLENWGVFAQGAYAVTRKLDIRAQLGVGVTWFSGLGDKNPFTNAAQAADGAVPMFALRAGLGLDWQLAGGLSVTVSPVVFARSSGPKNISDKINKIQQFDILIGIGYSL